MTPTEALRRLVDSAEMLWVVLANVSEGDWTKQNQEWQNAAARWRDEYFAANKAAQAALGAGFDVEKAMDYAKGYQDGQQIMASDNADLRARLQAIEAALVAAQEGLIQTGVEKAAVEAERDRYKAAFTGAVDAASMLQTGGRYAHLIHVGQSITHDGVPALAAYADRLAAALRSIAANTCCDRCQEAALVAQKALDAAREGGEVP